MMRVSLWATLAVLAVGSLPAFGQTIVVPQYPPVVVPAPVTSYYYGPAPVTTYYAPPVTSYYAPPVTSYYAPPVTSYYAPPVTSYYAPAPVVSYYAPPVTTYYAAPYAVTQRYGLFGRRVITRYYP